MDLVKASASTPAKAPEASKRSERQTRSYAQPEAVAADKPEQPSAPRATTNTRGEKIGQLLNARA